MSEKENGKFLIIRQQSALANFGELALRSDSLDEILTEACHFLAEALSTDLVKVVELQKDRKTLRVRAGVGWGPGVVGVQIIAVADDTPEGVVLRTGEPMVSPDIETETRFKYPTFIIEHGVRAVANVIITRSGENEPPFGILEVDSRLPREFTDQDIAFLSSYAHLIAAAVIRIRATEALEAKTRNLTELNAKLKHETDVRVRVEESLHQSQKMEAVGRLTGGLSHDFNNILTTISGSLELLRRRMAQGRIAELDRYIEASMTSVNRGAALTQRLLAFSRRQMLDPKIIDLNQIIRDMEDLFRHTIGPLIQIESRLADGLWPTLCDPNQVESVILNLAINARDAMPAGGHLTFETKNIVFPDRGETLGKLPRRNLPSLDYVDLSVTDTGQGMSPSVLQNAFDPFFTTKPIGQGTGLGLSMIHGFVRQSGGDVQLHSAIGHGTTVTIYLPRHFKVVKGQAAIDDDMSLLPPSGSVVLVVEDEEPIQDIIVELLEELGYMTLKTGDARSGLVIMETAPRVDLLITAVDLPEGINGPQLAAAARQRRPGLKVLFVTNYAEGDLAEKSLLARGTQIMRKPFPVNALAAMVRGMLNE